MLENRVTPTASLFCFLATMFLAIVGWSGHVSAWGALLTQWGSVGFGIATIMYFIDYLHDVRRRNWIASSVANAADPVARFAEAIRAMNEDQRALLFSLVTALASPNLDTDDLVKLPLTGQSVPTAELAHYVSDIEGDNAPAERSYQVGPARNAYRNIANELERAGLVQQQSGNQRSKIVDRAGLRRYMLDILK